MANATVRLADPAGTTSAAGDLDIDDAARRLGLASSLLRLRIETGEVPAHQGPRGLVIRADDFHQFKRGFDRQQRALRALADDTEDLMADHGL